MKKIICFALVVAGFVLASCEKDPIGGTVTQDMAGEWDVTIDAMDTSGNVLIPEYYHGQIYTYNTVENIPTRLWVDDMASFWDYKVEVSMDMNAGTFTSDGVQENASYECQVNIEEGKIVKMGTTTPSGVPTDYIEFVVSFSDDDPAFGYKYKVYGFRHTGLASDD
ncbi:MAG: hypothetical protein LBN29_07065 [Mediterranea sp.]|nr:hypothetical protein [Mediterranea sp.]